MEHAERIARLRLFRTESIGPITFYKLISRFGSAVQALDALPSMSANRKKKY
jgi:DNA processing protein